MIIMITSDGSTSRCEPAARSSVRSPAIAPAHHRCRHQDQRRSAAGMAHRRSASRRRNSAMPSRAALTQPQAAIAHGDPDMAIEREQDDGAGGRGGKPGQAPSASACACLHARTTPRPGPSPVHARAPRAAMAASAPATAALSRALKAPRSNRPATIGVGEQRQAQPPPVTRGRARARTRAIVWRRWRGDRRRGHARRSPASSPRRSQPIPCRAVIRRVDRHRYSHDTADGDDDATMVPASASTAECRRRSRPAV